MLPPKLLTDVPPQEDGTLKVDEAPKCLGLAVEKEGFRTEIDCTEDIAEMEDMCIGVRVGFRADVMRPAP